MIKLFRDCLTGKDNETYDIYRLALVSALIVYFTLSIYEVYQGRDFKPKEFGEGLGYIFGGGGLAIWLKRETEPAKRKQHG